MKSETVILAMAVVSGVVGLVTGVLWTAVVSIGLCLLTLAALRKASR